MKLFSSAFSKRLAMPLSFSSDWPLMEISFISSEAGCRSVAQTVSLGLPDGKGLGTDDLWILNDPAY
jgi:hypothetical protein